MTEEEIKAEYGKVNAYIEAHREELSQEDYDYLKSSTNESMCAVILANGKGMLSDANIGEWVDAAQWTAYIGVQGVLRSEEGNLPESAFPEEWELPISTINTINSRLLLLSRPEYQYSFVESTRRANALFAMKDGKRVPLEENNINIPFLQGLLMAVFLEYSNGNFSGKYSINYRNLMKEMGLDTRPGAGADKSRSEARKQTITDFIDMADSIYGAIPGDDFYYRLFGVSAINPNDEIIVFTSPYMEALIKKNVEHEQWELEEKKHSTPWKCELMHSDVANERNKAAIEMAERVLVGVQQRGAGTPDAKSSRYKNSKLKDKDVFTWSISCRSLINDCPMVKNLLNRQPNSREKTKVLKRAFPGMYKILKTKTDLFDYYIDVEMTELIPTWTTLSEISVTITHYGKNPDFVKK